MLYNNKIQNIEGLDAMIHLQALYLYNNKITNMDNLNHLSDLKELSLFDNKIRMIKGIDRLTNLEELNLSYNAIDRIYGLENLKNLRNLNLSVKLYFEYRRIKRSGKPWTSGSVRKQHSFNAGIRENYLSWMRYISTTIPLHQSDEPVTLRFCNKKTRLFFMLFT